jgi:hypothetical protein
MAINWRSGVTWLWLLVSILWVIVVAMAMGFIDENREVFWDAFLHGSTPGWIVMIAPPAVLLALVKVLAWVLTRVSGRSSK